MIRYGFALQDHRGTGADLSALTLAGHAGLLTVCRHNLRALGTMLRCCASARILMRISSDIIPLASHPQNTFDWRARLHEEFEALRAVLKKTGIGFPCIRSVRC